MANQSLPSPELLRKLLDYNPETGVLTWRERSPEHFDNGSRTAEHKANNWNARFRGMPALANISNNGYYRGPIMGQYMLAHRVIWALETGSWPEQQIDHINGNKLDNRRCNLREADHITNGRNAKRKSNNTSGHNGVWWFAARKKWCAEITVNRKSIKLGYFEKIEDAADARRKAEAKYGFTRSHGRRG